MATAVTGWSRVAAFIEESRKYGRKLVGGSLGSK
jgi:hypothetical protein